MIQNIINEGNRQYLPPYLGYAMLICLVFTYQLVNGQAYDFTQYGIEQGIAHEQITDICQDIKGNLWIATQGGGVSKFNGISFKNYTVRDGLLSNYVRNLTTDNKGNVWMATAEGISMYNGSEIENSTVFQNTLKKSVNTILRDANGKLWYATAEQGVSFIDEDGSIHSFNQSNGFVNDRVIDIKEGWDGRIWLVTIVNGVYQYQDDKFLKVVSTTDVKGYILSITVRDEHIILATNRGIFKYDNQLSPVEDFDKMFIKSIVSRNNELWAITANSLVQNRNGHNIEFSQNAGFSLKLPTVGFCDREGNLWFGTSGDGVYKFTNTAFVKFDSRHGLKNEDILSIVMDKEGRYWFGTNGGGIYSYDGENMTNYTTAHGLPNNYITSSAMDKKGDIWFGTRGGGVVNYNGKRFETHLESEGLVHNNVRSIYCSNNGNVWIATIHGLSKWDGISFQNYTTENGLLDDVVWDFQEYNGSTYFVTRKGVNVYQNGMLKDFYTSEKVFNKRVNTIRFSVSGELLIGYSGYGFRKINMNENLASDIWISSEDGLISDIIHNIEQIDSTKFLLTTERGIDLLKLSNEKLISINHMANKNSGLGLAKTNPGAIFRNRNHIWVGTQSGVFCYEYGADGRQEAPPIVSISSVELLNNNVPISYKPDSVHEFKYTQSSLGISYFGNCFNDAENVIYQYRLSNFQTEWSLPSTAINTRFTNLPSGDYKFEVRAKNSDGVISEQSAMLMFKITPPIWQRSWFYLLMTLLAIVLVRSFYLFRVEANVLKVLQLEKIREEEATKVRETMARDFHDNMGNQLASITVFSNLISMKLKNRSREIDDLLENIEKHSKSLYNGTKDFIWSMNPESDNLLEIFTYIKDFGEDFLSRTNIDFYADTDVFEGGKIAVPSGWSRQIVLVFKEAMTNSLKHSKASKLHLSLQLEDDSFVIRCSDNGNGIEEAKLNKGNGYKNMHIRASKIGCNLEIINNIDGEGLLVIFKGKLQKKELSEGIKIF